VLSRPRDRDDQGGYSLVELLVVMLMVSVIGGMVTSSVVTGMRTAQRTEARTYALADIHRGLERVGRELQAANPIDLDLGGNYGDALGATVVRDGHRVEYRYYLQEQADGRTDLLENVRRTDLATGVSQTQNGLFIADIANEDTGTPLFTYYETDAVSKELRRVDCTSLDAAACRQAHQGATQITLTLEKYIEGQDDVIVVETTVNVRNTRLG
jgi:prepilin-type N-terminal cleavage/methylation domain-containing protein